MNDAKWRQGFARLADHGFLFELQVFTSQFADGAKLARDFPGTIFVLMHCGMPEDLSQAGMAAWRDGLKRLADEPNMMVKLSGLGTFIRRNDAQHVARIVGETVEAFGPERCVFGSNFPVEKLWCQYGDLVSAYRQAVAGLPEAAQRAILHDNAKRIYGL
jgi:predicted TIM-barrel fold metal-dependent hydrolase